MHLRYPILRIASKIVQAFEPRIRGNDIGLRQRILELCPTGGALLGVMAAASSPFPGLIYGDVLPVFSDGHGAHATIHAAIESAKDGDEILVGPGEYVLDRPIDFSPDGGAKKDLVLRSVAGLDQTVLRMSPREFVEPGSILIFDGGETDRSVVVGFTMTGGIGITPPHTSCDGLGCERYGGAIYCVDSSPVFMDCRIVENVALAGSAQFCGGGHARGGGVYLGSSSARFIGCEIRGNAAIGGAALLCAFPSGGDGHGGGIDVAGEGVPEIINCRIQGNLSSRYGGGISVHQGSQLLVRECEISGNLAVRGGAIYLYYFSQVELQNVVLTANRAETAGPLLGSGGAALVLGGRLDARNVTIFGNSASRGVGGIDVSTTGVTQVGQLVLRNAIVWDSDGAGLSIGEGAVAVVGFSCIEGNRIWTGDRNSNDPPLFFANGKHDFTRVREIEMGGIPVSLPDFILEPSDLRLRSGSTSIDSGTERGSPKSDIRGSPRPIGSGFDRGAFESDGEPATFQRGDVDGDGRIGIADAVIVLNNSFLQGTSGDGLHCAKAVDCDDDGSVTLGDVVLLLEYLFLGGRAPRPPFPACGVDPTDDVLSCMQSFCEGQGNE
jgi:hypothetical protein